MKTAIVGLAFLAALPAIAQTNVPVATGHPSIYNFAGVQYPRIEDDNRVSFRFNAPAAQKVQVSIVNVSFDMIKGDDGVWTYTTKEPQDLGYHNYWMIVDGTIVLDPNVETFIGYSHMCNGFEIPDPEGGFYQIKDVPHGMVQTKDYYAKTLNAWHRIYVYTPPGYEANTSARYPVLYLQHGGGEDRRVWIEMGRANTILDNMLAEGKVKPMIVVMETSTPPSPVGRGGAPGRGAGAAPTAARGPGSSDTNAAPGVIDRGAGGPGRGGLFNVNAFENVMIHDLIPFIDANFRTLADQPHRAMAGLSMGSMQTHQITMAHLDTFSHIGLFSGGTISTNEITDMAAFKQKVNLVFASYGSREIGGNRGTGAPRATPAAGTNAPPARGGRGGDPQASTDALKAAGVNSVFYVSPLTAHEWQSWRRSLREFAPLLFKD